MELTDLEKNVLWLRANEYSKKEINIILKIKDNEMDDIFRGIANKIQTVEDTIEMNKILEKFK